MTWERLAGWWIDELAADPAYDEEIAPLLIRLLDPQPDRLYADLGCGTGRLATRVSDSGARIVGCDLNLELLRIARKECPVVQSVLPDLRWVRRSSFDGAYVGLVLEHVEDEAAFFAQVAEAVRPGGVLAMVINHPVWTAPRSTPIEVPEGEILWRTGAYFGKGFSDEPAGKAKVRFYHRSMAHLLNAASNAGWDVRYLSESGISQRQMERFPEYAGQEQIPRLLGIRWEQRQPSRLTP
ncbi:MAG: class I SAM-dependent DNA methyltransferase [Acidimicrobiia bacterium]